MRKTKITEAGQPCRHCQTPVVQNQHKPGWKPRVGRIWYSYWFACPHCRAVYMVQAARQLDQLPQSQKPAQRREQFFDDDNAERFANELYEQHGRDLAPVAGP